MTDVEMAPPVGQPIDLAEPWTPPVSSSQDARAAEPVGFHEWVDKWVAATAPAVERKAAEYGSNSLAKKGYRFAAAQQRAVTLPAALELGVANYIAEKVDRLEDAMLRGQLGSEDTWVDIANYALMALYIREHGHWA